MNVLEKKFGSIKEPKSFLLRDSDSRVEFNLNKIKVMVVSLAYV